MNLPAGRSRAIVREIATFAMVGAVGGTTLYDCAGAS
jgi:hypothetical protein